MTDLVSVRKTSSILDEWRHMQNRVMRRAYVKAELKNGLLRVTAEVAEGSGHRNIKPEAA